MIDSLTDAARSQLEQLVSLTAGVAQTQDALRESMAEELSLAQRRRLGRSGLTPAEIAKLPAIVSDRSKYRGSDAGYEGALQLSVSDADAEVSRLLAEHSEALSLSLSNASGGGDADAIAARHPELFGKRPSNRHGNGRFAPRGRVTTKNRAHSEDEDPTDHAQPARGGQPHAAEVERLMREHGPALAAQSSGSRRGAVPSPAQREAAERRARPGHTGRGGASIPDMAQRGPLNVR